MQSIVPLSPSVTVSGPVVCVAGAEVPVPVVVQVTAGLLSAQNWGSEVSLKTY